MNEYISTKSEEKRSVVNNNNNNRYQNLALEIKKV